MIFYLEEKNLEEKSVNIWILENGESDIERTTNGDGNTSLGLVIDGEECVFTYNDNYEFTASNICKGGQDYEDDTSIEIAPSGNLPQVG